MREIKQERATVESKTRSLKRNYMPKIPSSHAFFNVNKSLLLILGPYETIVLSYVVEWQAKGKPCFSSRKTISAETGFSEKTVQNTIKALVDKGYLAISHHKRKRTLTVTDKVSIWYPQRGYNMPSEGVRDTQMRGYDVLTTNKEITNKDITNKKLLKSDLVLNETEEEPMGKESEKEKELRLRLNALRNDPQGWEDHGSFLTKFDPETRTTLRKTKPVHPEKTWNGKGDWSDLPE